MNYFNQTATVTMCLVAFLGTMAGAGAEHPKRRIIVNDDGLAADNTEFEKRFLPTIDTQVDSYFLCIGQTSGALERLDGIQAFWFPERKAPAELDKLTRTYLEGARESRGEIFASFRMNDAHDAWESELTYPLKVERPDLLIGQKRSYPEDSFMSSSWSGFDYAKKDVREHFRDFILSWCHAYDFDGVELDFFRHPRFFKPGEEQENLDTMTEFVRRVRQGLNQIGDQRGRAYLVAVRVPDTLTACRRTGLDVERWLKESLLDMLIVGGGGKPMIWSYGDLKEFIDIAHQHNVLAYPCINQFREPIKMRSYASNFWTLGADGVHIFNYFGVPVGSEKHDCLKQMGDPDLLVGLDKLYEPVKGGGALYVGYTSQPPRFPLSLIAGTPIELMVGDNLAKAAQQGILKDVRLRVKVAEMEQVEGITIKINGTPIPAREIDRLDSETFEAAVTTPPLRQGINQVVILPGLNSVARLSSTVNWVELSVDYR